EEVTEAELPLSSSTSGARCAGQVEVVNERGLHLRAAHLLAQLSGQYEASVQVGWSGHMVNAKSLLGITTLGASKGSQLGLEVEGPDAEAAFAAIKELFACGFEEGTE
ncbi:MAG: HPr family phosphocarrier protein, partial [Myxococcota bacterium]